MNEKVRFKRLIVIHVILILILIGLTMKVVVQESDYSCDECTIKFEKWQSYGDEETKLTVSVPLQRLHKSYLEGECPVKWDKANSYLFAEDFDVTITNK